MRTLPVSVSNAITGGMLRRPRPPCGGSNRRRGCVASLSALRILVVDDNQQMRTILGTVLAAAGVRQLYFANHGRQGLEVISRHAIDRAYVDYEMPVMNGLDFIAAVRGMKPPAC